MGRARAWALHRPALLALSVGLGCATSGAGSGTTSGRRTVEAASAIEQRYDPATDKTVLRLRPTAQADNTPRLFVGIAFSGRVLQGAPDVLLGWQRAGNSLHYRGCQRGRLTVAGQTEDLALQHEAQIDRGVIVELVLGLGNRALLERLAAANTVAAEVCGEKVDVGPGERALVRQLLERLGPAR